MGRINWLSVLALLYMVLSCLAMIFATMEQAVAFGVLAVTAAILAHLR